MSSHFLILEIILRAKAMKAYKTKIPLDVFIYLQYLHQDRNIRIKELVKEHKQYSKTSIYWHAKKSLNFVAVSLLNKAGLNQRQTVFN